MRDKSYKLHQAVAFKLRGVLMIPLVAFLFFWTQWEWEYELGVWTIGLSPFLLGVALRVWAQRYLRYRLREGKALATVGPYAWTRNPVYVGNTLMLVGLCIMCELPWAIPIVIGWAALVYHATVRFEEDRLTKRYGEAYAAYCRRVPRWLPCTPLERTLTAPSASLWRAVTVEWQCLVLLIVPVVKECFH